MSQNSDKGKNDKGLMVGEYAKPEGADLSLC